MGQVKAPEVEQPEKKSVDLIPEERLKELLNILLPYGYSYHDGSYTGVSPYIGDTQNIITIVANDPECWGSVFAICMERFTPDEDEVNSLGFYKGIMKLIAPELVSTDNSFMEMDNILGFNWASDKVQDNRFPVKVTAIHSDVRLKNPLNPRLLDMSVEDRKREWLRIMANAKPMPSSGRWKPKEKKQLYTRKPKTD